MKGKKLFIVKTIVDDVLLLEAAMVSICIHNVSAAERLNF